jgi:chromosome partitioning protein
VAQSFIADRVVYAAAMTSGETAPELEPKGAAAKEIAALWTEIKSYFHEKLN